MTSIPEIRHVPTPVGAHLVHRMLGNGAIMVRS